MTGQSQGQERTVIGQSQGKDKTRRSKEDKNKAVFAQFPEARGIHRGFSNWKMKDDYQNKFASPLAIDFKFFHRTFANAGKI
jgi:hypothetical protein